MTKELVELFWIDHKVQQKTGWCDVVRGKPMAWDVTIPDTFANSHLVQTDWYKTLQPRQGQPLTLQHCIRHILLFSATQSPQHATKIN